MKRIAFDARIWGKESGGISRYSHNLLAELLKFDSKNEYTLILLPDDAVTLKLKAKNLKTLVVDIPIYSGAEQKDFLKILNNENFDLVHFPHFNHPILYRRPFITTLHDLIGHFYPSGRQNNSLIRKLAYRTLIQDCRRAKRILVPSESTKRDLIKKLHFPLKRILVTPEGSEEGLFRHHTAAEIAGIKQKLHLPEHFLLFVSRWEKYKGLNELIAAFEGLTPEFPDLGLVITGTPRWQDPAISQTIQHKQREGLRIITPGFVDDADLAALYSAATIFVHPSWYEGFGIMILEAFASNTPVITSTISSLPEVAGDAALLINPHEPKEIMGAIRDLLRDPVQADTLRKRGRERLTQFSWRRMAEETHQAYMEVLSDQK